VTYRETSLTEPANEILFGPSSWDDARLSIKNAYLNANGSIARPGEIPVEVVPQMMGVLIRQGVITPLEVAEMLVRALRPQQH
jgi:hypothetical protein